MHLHKIKCWKCRHKNDISKIIERKEYIEIPYDDKRGNYECIVYQCEECGIDNIYMKVKEE